MTQPPQRPEHPEPDPYASGPPVANDPPAAHDPFAPPPHQHPQPGQHPPPPPPLPPPPGAAATQPLYPGAAYGAPPPAYSYGQPAHEAYPPAMPQRANGLSIASMVISIVSAIGLCCYGLGGYLGLIGAIFGHVAKRQIANRDESGDGMALAGIIVGWVALGLSLLVTAGWVWFFIVAATDPSFFETLD